MHVEDFYITEPVGELAEGIAERLNALVEDGPRELQAVTIEDGALKFYFLES